MAKRTTRVSEAQWGLLLDYLERHPNLARARGYNNSARGRAESLRLWEEIAASLNAEGSGTTKNAKDWSVYVSNYKSKLKKILADINADVTGTGGGPPRGGSLSDVESRFLAIMGEGFGQTAPQVSVEPFPNEDPPQPSTSSMPQAFLRVEDTQSEEAIEVEGMQLLNIDIDTSHIEQQVAATEVWLNQAMAQCILQHRLYLDRLAEPDIAVDH